MKSDLHCHTIYSDGTYGVKDLIDLAKHIKLDCIAITDHDVVSGVSEAIEYGNQVGLKIISGIELSTFSNASIHILGYNIDYNSSIIHELARELLDKRKTRKDEIVNRLHSLGVYLDSSNLDGIENVGRAHIAKELVAQKFVSCHAEAFDKYIGQDKPAYVPSKRLTPKDGVKVIRAIGGEAVIAHPMMLYNAGLLKPLIEGLKPYGLGGLEVYYPNHSSEDVYRLSKLADEYKLFKTGGSDFHGVNKSNTNALGATTCELPKELY